MHPACSDGEDERDCTGEYVKKNYLPAGASYPCQSPHYPDLMEILAVRCDSVSECYEDKDEKGCKQPLVQSEIIGDKHGENPIIFIFLFFSYRDCSTHICFFDPIQAG